MVIAKEPIPTRRITDPEIKAALDRIDPEDPHLTQTLADMLSFKGDGQTSVEDCLAYLANVWVVRKFSK